MWFCFQIFLIIIVLREAQGAWKGNRMYVSGATVDPFKRLLSRFFLGSSDLPKTQTSNYSHHSADPFSCFTHLIIWLQLLLCMGIWLSFEVHRDRSEVWLAGGMLLDLGAHYGPSHLQGYLTSCQSASNEILWECALTRSVLLLLIMSSRSAIHNSPPTFTVPSLQADLACPLMAHHLLTFLPFSAPDTPPSVLLLLTAFSHLVSGCWQKTPWTHTCFLDSQKKYFLGNTAWACASHCHGKSRPFRVNILWYYKWEYTIKQPL